MKILRRVFISSPRDEHLDEHRNKLKWAIVKEIETLGYEAQVFGSLEGGRGLATRSWSPSAVEDVMRSCIGAAILGFPIWQCSGTKSGERVLLVTRALPLRRGDRKNVWTSHLGRAGRGCRGKGLLQPICQRSDIRVPADADPTWVAGIDFRGFLDSWNARIGERRDIFLAYSGKQEGTAGGTSGMLTRTWCNRHWTGKRTLLEGLRFLSKSKTPRGVRAAGYSCSRVTTGSRGKGDKRRLATM